MRSLFAENQFQILKEEISLLSTKLMSKMHEISYELFFLKTDYCKQSFISAQ